MSTFSISVSREQLEAARARLAAQGIVLQGDSGEVEGHKVRVAFSYDGTANLVLTVEHKPVYYPEARVEAEIREWFSGT